MSERPAAIDQILGSDPAIEDARRLVRKAAASPARIAATMSWAAIASATQSRSSITVGCRAIRRSPRRPRARS